MVGTSNLCRFLTWPLMIVPNNCGYPTSGLSQLLAIYRMIPRSAPKAIFWRPERWLTRQHHLPLENCQLSPQRERIWLLCMFITIAETTDNCQLSQNSRIWINKPFLWSNIRNMRNQQLVVSFQAANVGMLGTLMQPCNSMEHPYKSLFYEQIIHVRQPKFLKGLCWLNQIFVGQVPISCYANHIFDCLKSRCLDICC